MRGTGLKLVVTATILAATLAGGTAVRRGAAKSGAEGEALVPAAAAGGPVGRMAIAGPWIVAPDPDDLGLHLDWSHGRFGGRPGTLPYVANAAKVTGAAGVAAYRGGIAWYRTTLTAPRTASYALRFESVHHVATVWLDGRQVGTHTGAYLPFEFRLRLREGVPHTLVVRADFRYPTRQKRDGWHRTWFNYGGINREVTLRPLARSELEAPGIHTQLYRGAAIVDVDVVVHNRARATRTLRVRGALRRGRVAIPLVYPPVRVGPGDEKRVTTRAVVKAPALLAPGSPSLYALHLGSSGG